MFDIEPTKGLVCFEDEDFSLNGEYPFFFVRRYSNLSSYNGPFGPCWVHPYDIHLFFNDRQIHFVDGEARKIALDGLKKKRRIEIPAEDLIVEIVDDYFLLHQGGDRTLTFSRKPLRAGILPLIRVDQTDDNSVYLSYHKGRLHEIRTSSFHRLCFKYHNDQIKHISLFRSPNNESILSSYKYDKNGQLVAVTDAQRNSTTYEYSGGLLTRYTNKMGGSFYIEYDQIKRATAIWQDGLSRLRKVLYDDKRHTRLVIDSAGHSTLLRYNDNDLLIEATLFDGSKIERAYADGSEPIALIGSGNQPIFDYDAEANVVEESDPDGSVSKLKFDDRNRVIEETDPDGGVTRYEYDDYNRITRQVNQMGGVETFEFNQNGNLISYKQILGNVVRANRTGNGHLEINDRIGPIYISDHDLFGNTTRITAPSGKTTYFEHDPFGRMTLLKTGSHSLHKWYDANGFIIAETDILGNRTEYERDSFGLLLAWTNSLGRRIEYLYDSERRLVGGRTSDGIECRYKYDARGRLVYMKLRDGREEMISYDQNGLRSAVSSANGQSTKYLYTSSGQLSDVVSPSGVAHYEYDTGGNCVLAECDSHSVTRQWAPGDCLIIEQQDDFIIEYEHNVAGLVTLRKDSTDRTTRYTYDVRGQLVMIDDSVFGKLEIKRDSWGSQIKQLFPNGIIREFEFGDDDEVSKVVTREADGTIVRVRSYLYAPNSELVQAQTDDAESLRFEYDAEYQLTNLYGENARSETFTYDLDHNIIYNSNLGHYQYKNSYLVEAGNIRYQYDKVGRVASRIQAEKQTIIKYSMGGLICEAVLPNNLTYKYEYDGFGRRVLKRGPGLKVRYYWDQDVLLYEEREAKDGKFQIHYLFIPDTFIPIGHSFNGNLFYYDLDQRALIREVYDEKGSLAGCFNYQAFGKRNDTEALSAKASPPFRLLGQIFDEETGLHYNRFRYYDAETGRFLSPDLSMHQVEHNPYAYGPNPINWADPYGLMARFSRADSNLLKEQQAASNGGFFECSNCGFKNKNKVFAKTKETGRPVGDGSFHAGHKKAHAKGGSANIKRNAQVEGGTCNCSKGKRKKSGMT